MQLVENNNIVLCTQGAKSTHEFESATYHYTLYEGHYVNYSTTSIANIIIIW